ncbi:MAG: EAL domain-containing protein [Burkholderiaceae bacterium]|nr:EAL domain-containing protein [Sulfuritalea sp.]MCF8174595.1 EAL domain-containing protein [Burkholderiaceae bacterium]
MRRRHALAQQHRAIVAQHDDLDLAPAQINSDTQHADSLLLRRVYSNHRAYGGLFGGAFSSAEKIGRSRAEPCSVNFCFLTKPEPKRLPLDQLKIDQSFVHDMLSNAHDASIARTIIALAENLGLHVIAEGVDTEEQRNFLSDSGCHAYQGYLFSRPLPLAGFEAFVKPD